MTMKSRILFVEDEDYLMTGVIDSLKEFYNVEVRTTGAEALHEIRVRHKEYDLILLDLMLPHGRGVDPEDNVPGDIPVDGVGVYVLEKICSWCRTKPVLVLTATRTSTKGMPTKEKLELLTKPVVFTLLYETIEKLLTTDQGSDGDVEQPESRN